MSEADNRSAANLILLCVKHADEVDLTEQLDVYTVGLLKSWKASQLASYDHALGGWELSNDEAAEVLERSNETVITFQAHTITLGGTGGSAPGATGGGGAAIGPGSIGGPGGPVGHIQLGGTPGTSPGAGGGGGGVMAPGAIRSGSLNVSQATEGQGFSSGNDGEDGGDTTISIGGEVLIRAAGGKGGLTGTGIRLTSERLTVSTMMLVNYVECAALASIVGGGWQSYSILNVPSPVVFPVFILFEAGGVETGDYTAAVEVLGPDGTRRARMSFPVTVERRGDVLRIPRACALLAELDCLGLWTLAVTTPSRELARIPLLVKRAGEA